MHPHLVSPVAALSALLTGRVSIPCARTVGIAVPSTAKAVSKVFIGRSMPFFDVSVDKVGTSSYEDVLTL